MRGLRSYLRARAGLSERTKYADLSAARDREVAAWPPFSLRWKTRRGGRNLTGDGHFWVWGTAIFAVAGFVSPLLFFSKYNSLFDCVALALMLAALFGWRWFLRAWANGDPLWLREDESAAWTLSISPAAIRLEKESPDGGRQSQEINRVEAGTFDLEWGRGRQRLYFVNEWVRSLDQAVTIRFPHRTVNADRSVVGSRHVALSGVLGGLVAPQRTDIPSRIGMRGAWRSLAPQGRQPSSEYLTYLPAAASWSAK